MSTGEVFAAASTAHVRSGASTFDRVDDALFDVDAVVSTTRDIRSVAEMLIDVDHQGRQLLLDVDGDAAAGLVRSWSPMVEAAAELLAALPSYEPRHGPPPPIAQTIERLLEHALVGRDAVGRGWPGPGPVDSRVATSTAALKRAAELVRRYGSEIPTSGHEADRDLDSVRTRVVHGLYVTAHAITVSLLAHGRDLFEADQGDRRRLYLSSTRTAYAVKPLAGWVDRMTTAETLGHQYLSKRFPSAASDPSQETADPGRVPRALAGWDIQAHRSLAKDASAVDVVLVSRVQALQFGVAQLLVAAANAGADLGSSEPTRHRVALPSGDRLEVALHRAGLAWHDLASRWDDLPSPTDRPQPGLLRAAAEVRASFRAITHDDTTMLTPAGISTHPEFRASLTATLTSVQTAPELAEVIASQADNPALVGRARALSRRAHDDVERGVARPRDGDPDCIWVSPADILSGRLVPLPEPVVEGLQRAARAIETASSRASTASAVTVGSLYAGVSADTAELSSASRACIATTGPRPERRLSGLVP